MATLYLRNVEYADTIWYQSSGSYPSSTQSAQSDDDVSNPTDKNTIYFASPTIGSSEQSKPDNIPGVDDYCHYGMWATPPLLEGLTLESGQQTFDFRFATLRTSGISNLVLGVFAYLWRPSTGSKVVDITDDLLVDATAITTTQRWRAVNGFYDGADTNIVKGDIIIIEAWIHRNSGVASPDVSLFYNGTTDDYATAGESTAVTDSASHAIFTQVDFANAHIFQQHVRNQ